MVKLYRPLRYGTEFIDYIPFCERINAKSRPIYIVNIETYKAVSAANVEFTTMGGTLTHLRVTTGGSYKKVDVKSGNSDDSNSGATLYMRSVEFWGVDSNNYLRVESVNLSKNTAVSSTNSYYEIGNMYGKTFGTAPTLHKNLGRVDLGFTGKVTNECMSITSAQNHAFSTRVPIPKYWRARIISVDVRPKDADVGLSSGVMIYPHYYDEYDSGLEASSNESISIMRDGAHLDENVFPRIYGNDNTYGILEFYGNRVKGSETWSLKARVVLYPTELATSAAKSLNGAP